MSEITQNATERKAKEIEMKRFTRENTTGYSDDILDVMNKWFDKIIIGISVDDENYRIIADNYSNIVLKTFEQHCEKINSSLEGHDA